MSSIPRVFRLVAALAIMTAGLAIPSVAHAQGGSPQFPFCAATQVSTYPEFVYEGTIFCQDDTAFSQLVDDNVLFHQFRLTYQADGNLVLYRDQWAMGPVRYVGTRPIWASNTGLRGLGAALFQQDGNLVVYNGLWRPLWASNTCCRSGNFLKVQTDGNLVIYTSSLRPIWASNTAGTP